MLASSGSRSTGVGASAPMSVAPPSARLTMTAWSPQGQLTVADWVRQGHWLGALSRASGWWIGDWIRYGNTRYGERYVPAARVTGYDLQSLRNMAYVAGRFEASRRREALSFSHHAELAGLPADEQELWLDRAEANTLSVRSLRSELRQARRHAAARAALAEARRSNAAATSVPPKRTTSAEEIEAPVFAAGRGEARRTGLGARLGCEVDTASDAVFELVCPECGCHFTPALNREGAYPAALPGGSGAPAGSAGACAAY
jgi:hypothetical protein